MPQPQAISSVLSAKSFEIHGTAVHLRAFMSEYGQIRRARSSICQEHLNQSGQPVSSSLAISHSGVGRVQRGQSRRDVVA
jgi:hypothetical protein